MVMCLIHLWSKTELNSYDIDHLTYKFTTEVSITLSFSFKVNGVNLIRMHANNTTAYGRILLDTPFTRQELKDSLLFASKKSKKPALDRAAW